MLAPVLSPSRGRGHWHGLNNDLDVGQVMEVGDEVAQQARLVDVPHTSVRCAAVLGGGGEMEREMERSVPGRDPWQSRGTGRSQGEPSQRCWQRQP